MEYSEIGLNKLKYMSEQAAKDRFRELFGDEAIIRKAIDPRSITPIEAAQAYISESLSEEIDTISAETHRLVAEVQEITIDLHAVLEELIYRKAA
jgi:hypothetical protein